ncbi:hypothetical protein [Variovorax sp. YR216]|uniref:hypothetical protein n=1 Tax=Variovorax sp. YR216 TaxID=1882828 RepID=UPI000B8375BE|nr:hypothetical protein [Variovorax sp. YR216]
MRLIRPPTMHEFAVLRVLRAEAERLPHAAAAMAAAYLPTIPLPDDNWRSVLGRALGERAGDVPCPPLDELVAGYGRPGAWLPAAYHGDATDARYWLVGLLERTAEYLSPAPAGTTGAR